ncbi:MAG: hypothetical protein IH612_21200, partial [Desulfofustis sp.]|nr:hypothetical protein [Desulfofustis sp.]
MVPSVGLQGARRRLNDQMNTLPQLPMKPTASLHEQLLLTISAFIRSADNSLANDAGDPAFAEPLIGYARGDDPIFERYKDVVGPYHWTPLEAFQQAFPERAVEASGITVVSWVLPHTERTKCDNRQETFYPSESWARARYFGETVNDRLRRRVVDFFFGETIPALAPVLLPAWS